MSNQKKLMEVIIAHSESNDIKTALKEWVAKKSWTNPTETRCICNHPILECFEIKNVINNNSLSPVGNVCIQKFAKECDAIELLNSIDTIKAIRCDLCKKTLQNKKSYNRHLLTESHQNRIGTRTCIEPSCRTIIPEDKPEWCVRCPNCYKKHTGFKSKYMQKKLEKIKST